MVLTKSSFWNYEILSAKVILHFSQNWAIIRKQPIVEQTDETFDLMGLSGMHTGTFDLEYVGLIRCTSVSKLPAKLHVLDKSFSYVALLCN